MNVLLIWPFNLQAVEIPELFPLGLGYILANLDHHRYNARILDCTLEGIQPESARFKKEIKDFDPQVVGLSFWSSNAESVYRTSKTIRDVLPKSKIVYGGPHATAYGAFESEKKHADFVLSGEAEKSFGTITQKKATV
ncbi:hypothetical protein D1AOALGA4SA_9713 [Olavius algarvensis Delta 1 endosymbiont]|nr:hypothetical protein D1AOALGA4SA_9713 [Olavius algarvensis Delta 1 endosymbiont]